MRYPVRSFRPLPYIILECPPQLFTLPAFRSCAVTAFSFPQSQRHSQHVLPFLFSTLRITVRRPNTFPVRSSALRPFRASVFGTHPQFVTLPRTSLFVSTSSSFPQSQRHLHSIYPCFRLSVFSVTVSFPNRCPVRSFLLAIVLNFASPFCTPHTQKGQAPLQRGLTLLHQRVSVFHFGDSPLNCLHDDIINIMLLCEHHKRMLITFWITYW